MTPAQRLDAGLALPTKVRLTRKFAQIIDGIDLSRARAGEDIELSPRDAQLLIAEGWALPVAQVRDQAPRKSRQRRKRQRSA
jgi:hypothetical protein